MTESGIPPEVQRLIAERIASVAQLEILLLLQTNPTQLWNPDMLARELRIEPGGARDQLEALRAAGLVAIDPPGSNTYKYFPATPDLAAACVALAQAYLVRRVTVIGLIFASPTDKIRSFADAFRLRKERPDG